jgi:hypothetical protein
MDMIRHDDVSHEGEPVEVADVIENVDKEGSGTNRAQKGQAPIANESDEMQMAVTVVADEFVGHGGKGKSPTLLKTERVGHPEKPRHFLGIDVPEWYHPIVDVRQQKTKQERVGHPPIPS